MMSRSIIKIKNVLSNDQRKYLIKESEKLLFTKEELDNLYNANFPCDQTNATLHEVENLKEIHAKILEQIIKEIVKKCVISKSWVNRFTNKNSTNPYMHTHNSHLSVVYYARKIPLIHKGTLFEKEGFIKCSQNSAIIFPSDMKHTASDFHLPINRYTLAMDLLLV